MSTHDLVTPNGAPPADPLGSIIRELEGHLSPLSSEREQLEAQLRDLSEREARIREALVALRGSTDKRRPPHREKGQTRDKHNWSPSQKTLDDVYAALAKLGEPATYTEIAEVSGVSRSTAQKAVDELRKQARIRFVGQGGRGQANRFAVMPSD